MEPPLILRYNTCSGVDTPTINTPNEKTALLGAGPYNKCSINDVECDNVSDERQVLEESELHKAKDFQLIHVPKGAVSRIIWYNNIIYPC